MSTPIEIRHLHTLVTLRNTGNLTRAAAILHLTQSALSHQIKIIEDFYGIQLFIRKSSPLTFTPAGRRILELAEVVLPIVEETGRDLHKLAQGRRGTLRVTLECHTCFDWLMPVMDAFRQLWPEVELDILSGFQTDPIGLLLQDRADVAIVDELDESEVVDYHPLFRFEMVALLANEHPLASKPFLEAEDFQGETLITYAVSEDRIDLIRKILQPAGIKIQRRTTELTLAILQLVASQRGIAALPIWAVNDYLEKGYVTARQITQDKLFSEVWVATLPSVSGVPYIKEFVRLIRSTSQERLPGIELI